MFTLDHVVPWGRSFDEYRRMFALADTDLELKILGCGDGPAGFNAEATRRGASVVSCDPIYCLDAESIRERVRATYDEILAETRRNADQFVWDSIKSVDDLGSIRMAAMQDFLQDFRHRTPGGRYVAGALPSLPFASGSFDLALCSHFLFLYSTHLDEVFHQSAMFELGRVASEIRVFPLLALDGRPSRHLDSCTARLCNAGYDVAIEIVPYEFQRGGNEMMRVRVGRRSRDS